MKKLLVFLLVAACLISTFHFKTQVSPLFQLENIDKVCFVNSNSLGLEGIDVVESGNLFFNFCSLDVAKKHLAKLQQDCKSVQLYINNTDFEYVLKTLKAQQISETNLDNMKVLNCFTPLFNDCVFVDGKKINMQLALKESQIVVGFPIILSGY